MEIAKPIQNHISYKSSACDSIDEFLIKYSEDGKYLYGENKDEKISVMIEEPTTLEEAKSIVQIYNEIYEGTYPYKEMLDPKFIYQTFQDPTFHWGIFRFDAQKDPEKPIVGCFTITLDTFNKSAYMRGLNILPEYQGKINVRELSYAMIHRFCEQNEGIIDKWYNESRTAHNIVQYLSRQIGALPYAIYEGKDTFLNKKETDVLMVAYRKNALYNTRQPPEKIHYRVKPLYSRIAMQYNFEEIPTITSKFNLNYHSKKISKILDEISLKISRDSYGYKHFHFSLESTGDFMEGLHTLSVKNIEKIQYHCSNIVVFSAFLVLLEQYVLSEKIEYVELNVDASEINQIEILLNKKYQISGYIPAWVKNERINKFRDIVVFSWHSLKKNIPEPKLIQDTEILRTVLRQANSRNLNNVEVASQASIYPTLIHPMTS
ncbi:hypothetical protein [Candidatus Lokiarchaeum ossiferum]|uniref:hypothetical protein n=1 Tax=Candidatus Lokiarchaeum ossiferum TaxID=2951803 RepID=UPI00352CED4D